MSFKQISDICNNIAKNRDLAFGFALYISCYGFNDRFKRVNVSAIGFMNALRDGQPIAFGKAKAPKDLEQRVKACVDGFEKLYASELEKPRRKRVFLRRPKGLAPIIRRFIVDKDQSHLIFIAGASASGKTYLKEKWLDVFKQAKKADDVRSIEQDYYYKDTSQHTLRLSDKNRFYDEFNFDTPEALHLDTAAENLSALLNGASVTLPQYNFKTGKSSVGKPIRPKKFIIFEGLFALTKSFKNIPGIRVFVDARLPQIVPRWEAKQAERGKPKETWPKRWAMVYVGFKRFIQPHRAEANLVMNGEASEVDTKAALEQMNTLLYQAIYA